MSRVPFKVSARAARLIGRENVATSQGAITELVKNTYDADATACVIMFLPRYEAIPKSLSNQQFFELEASFSSAGEFYKIIDEKRTLNPSLGDYQLSELKMALGNILDLWIVDNGHGMSVNTIEDHWMVIGTNMKELDEKSKGGRIVTGAKGIGRFALDRLGQECELFSAEPNHNQIAHWYVDWGAFDGVGKIIDEVEAILEVESTCIQNVYKTNRLNELLPTEVPVRDDSQVPLDFNHGTAIKISYLHDKWDLRDSLKLKQTLEALLPPMERGDFNIYVYDHRDNKSSGWLENFPPDQFDYRLIAKIQDEGKISIQLDRQEIDVSMIRPSFFGFKATQIEGYSKQDFENGYRHYETTLKDLMKLDVKKNQEDKEKELQEYESIGPLEFTLYFFKLTNPSKDNLEKFPQKRFDVSKRRQWLANSGGIRLYRDGFRVRPYGEPNTQGSDWLLLGQRVAGNPAAVSRLDWRVPPQQLAGTINITKADNPLLADQSNREGIMNERAFSVFRKIILSLIREFEKDRSYIFHYFAKAYDLDNPEEKDVEEGKKLADKILDTNHPKPKNNDKSSSFTSENDDAEKIAKALKSEQKRNEDLKDEMQVLRGMATLGTVLVSFTHELKQIQANMDVRHSRLNNALERVVSQEKLIGMPRQLNPFDIVSRWQREDRKVSRWVDFALTAVSPKKRRRRAIPLKEYLDNLATHWAEFLETKNVGMNVSCEDESIMVLAHEIDLDSIFYNLIINSVEAFIKPSGMKSREIWINVEKSSIEKNVLIYYKDNGPGLTSDLNSEDDIFIYGFSTKNYEEQSEVKGTGIGMWLVKSIIDDYNGKLSLDCNVGEESFSLSMEVPLYV